MKDQHSNLEYQLNEQSKFNQTQPVFMNNYNSAHQHHAQILTPPKQVSSQQNIAPHFTYKEQVPLSQPQPINLYSQNPLSWQASKTPQMDYRISKDVSYNQDSRNNISTEILSNDQSRIKPSAVLKLRSDSPANDRSQIGQSFSNRVDQSSNLVGSDY